MKIKITCPNTAHLEEIEYEMDPVDGHILGITRCSAFSPDTHVDCDCLCAKRINQRALCDGAGRAEKPSPPETPAPRRASGQ
jgi:hypothetical protein